MSTIYEAMGPGGHETYATSIFSKIKTYLDSNPYGYVSKNTTYSLSASGESVVLTGSDNSSKSVSLGTQLLPNLPVWTANPTDDVYLIRRDTAGANAYGQVKFSTVWNYIKGKADSVYVNVTGDTMTGNLTAPKFIGALDEANLTWGGKNFFSSYGCIDAALMDELGANRFQFIKASAITVEYSRDGGSTWTDYGATDAQKQQIFAQGGYLIIGKADSTHKATEHPGEYQLRITIDTGVAGIYSVLNKFIVYVSSSGSANCACKIQKALQSTPTTFVDHTDWISVGGWSGYNVLNVNSFTTYGNSPSGQYYGRVRFIFKDGEGGNTNYFGLSILQIKAFGGVGWITPSTMAKTGHLYSYDQNQNAVFPKNVTATKFIGALQGNADTATSATTASKLGSSNVGSATQPIYLNGGTATACTYTLGKTVPSDAVFTDTKNTAGSTDTSSKIFLIGATSQAANPQTYSHDTAYVGTDGCLYSGGTKVLTAHQSVTDNNPTLSWGTKSKVATIGGTAINVTMPSNPNTDAKVTQTATDASSNAEYEILFSETADNTTRTEGARKTSQFTFNPQTNQVTAGHFTAETSSPSGNKTANLLGYDIQLGGTSNTWDGTYTSLKDAIANRVSKAGDTMSGNLTAPKFIGALQGNADTATCLNRAGTNTQSTSSTAFATGAFNVRWFTATGKIPGQPSQYGFLLTTATGTNSVENHQIFVEQANGNLYHRGTNASTSSSPPAFKTILDSSNYTSFTRNSSGVIKVNSVTKTPTNAGTSLASPTPLIDSGYKFLCWLYVQSNGYIVGANYPGGAANPSATWWFANGYLANYGLTFYYLEIKDTI